VGDRKDTHELRESELRGKGSDVGWSGGRDDVGSELRGIT